MKAELQKEHDWLNRLVGEWTVEMETPAEPEQPAHPPWTEAVRSLESAWVVAEAGGTMPDGRPLSTIMTLGYDPNKQRYVGTFIGSMMTHMWVYEGAVNPSGQMLELDTAGPTFDGSGGMAKYRDTIEFINDHHRTLRSRVLNKDGEWQEFMVAHYRRKR